jgi:hypothetical protein
MCLQISPRKFSLSVAGVGRKNFSGFIGWLMWGLIPIKINEIRGVKSVAAQRERNRKVKSCLKRICLYGAEETR